MPKPIVPKDSRYIPFTQQPYSCVPTSILMVMYRHGIPLLPPEELGHYFGLSVPKEVKQHFWNPRIGKRPASKLRPHAGYGTRIFEKGYEPNIVFKKLNIPLTMLLKSINDFPSLTEFKKYLSSLSGKEFDVLMNFHHGNLVNDPERDNGHVVVLDKIYLSKGTLRYVDPERRGAKWKIVSIKKLYEAMRANVNSNTAGFWEIKPIKKPTRK